MPPQVEGLTPGRLLGSGASGEVWTAVDSRSGRTVAVKVLRADAQAELSRREASVLRRLDHPHVLRLHRTARTADGRLALVTDHAAGGSLAALVSARGPLDPGEVVTVLTPIAGALADLHERGVVHGDVSPGNVLFLADGRPVLADLGTAGLLGVDPATHATPGFADPALASGGGVQPGSDVHALGAVAWFALTGAAPEPAGHRPPLIPVAPATLPELASLVERCLEPEPRRRPSAAEVGVAAYRAVDPVPVRLVPTDPHAEATDVVTHRLRQDATLVPAPDPGRTRGSRLRPLVLACTAGLLLVTGTAVAASFGVLPGQGHASAGAAADVSSRPSPSVPGPRATTMLTPTFTPDRGPTTPDDDPLASDDLAVAIEALSALRAEGFSTTDQAPLRSANVKGSPALSADLATLADLEQQQVRLDGLTFTVDDVVVLGRAGDTATVRVTVVTGAHQVVGQDATAEVVEQVEASAPAPVRLVLVRVDGRWRVNEVL